MTNEVWWASLSRNTMNFDVPGVATVDFDCLLVASKA